MSLEPGIVVVGTFDDLVGNQALDALDLLVGEGPADEALDGVEGVVGVGDGLTAGGHADEAGAVVGEGDDGGSCPGTLGVFDDAGVASLLFICDCSFNTNEKVPFCCEHK